MTCISYVKCVSVRGVSVAVNEIFVQMDTHLSDRWIRDSAMARIPQFTDFIPAKTWGRVMKFMLYIYCS